MRSTFILVALALIVLPLAAAQVPAGPPTPVYTVEIQGAPGAFTGLAANTTASAAFKVVLTLSNAVCASAVVVPVTVTAAAAGAPNYFSVAVDPAVINITIAQGAYGPTGAGGGSGDATAKAMIKGNITSNASVQVALSADAPAPPGPGPGAPPTGCQGAGTIAAAKSAPVTVFANMTAPPAPPPPTPTPAKKGLPGFEFVALAVAVIAVTLGRKQR